MVLSSRLRHVEVAERGLLDLCRVAGISSDDEYWLVTALREALANAIRHGNREQPDRKVWIRLAAHPARVTMRVDDEGEGFDAAAIPDPTAPDRLLQTSGRGIFYMRQFMTRVEFSRAPGGGTSVLMERDLGAAGRSNAHEE